MSWVSELPAPIVYSIKQIYERLSARDVFRKEEIQTQLIAVIRSLLAIEACNYIVDFDLFTQNDDSADAGAAAAQIIPVEYNEFDAIRLECAKDCQCTIHREKQSVGLGYYLIRDILPIILDYSVCHIQHFAVGNPVAFQETLRWYAGTVEHIVVVNNFAFLFVRAATFTRSEGDWIPANSTRLKCFYDSRRNRIEKAEFIATRPDKSHCVMDCFHPERAEWSTRDWFDADYRQHHVFAESGTFTS